MNNDNNQNVYVGDGDIRLYTFESDIAKKSRRIINSYVEEFNNKDFIKKSIELFHLLSFLDVNGDFENIHKVIPNEPGDFIVTINGKDILYEVITVFGDIEAKSITNLVKEILEINDVPQFDTNEYSVMNT